MKNKKIVDFIVQRNEALGYNFTRLSLQADCELPEIAPGQFVQVQIPSSVHGWLRIPVSVHFADAAKGQVWLLVQKVGDGSRKIAALQEGGKVNLVLPLGQGFALPQENTANGSEILLVGGGCGIAPLYYLGIRLKEWNLPFRFLTGARIRERLALTEELARMAPLEICTEDGSQGFKGLVTEHPLWKEANISLVYTCGPTPMMKAVARKAAEKGTYCQVSLENTMACGLGACLCCVTPMADGHNTCVCTEGPVFDSRKLGW
ncbi:MAG: dihydroorotate dehydrogenase electron transfer subunit [Bacteroides sp.]|nr:dihydroorotate dehydrogenase electron transfer subunit [Ruminococcus flavefaciens]MCM1554201.1 dihydroorotate dehydrogenase electron transfer subunit [Bacteroides sp.]